MWLLVPELEDGSGSSMEYKEVYHIYFFFFPHGLPRAWDTDIYLWIYFCSYPTIRLMLARGKGFLWHLIKWPWFITQMPQKRVSLQQHTKPPLIKRLTFLSATQYSLCAGFIGWPTKSDTVESDFYILHSEEIKCKKNVRIFCAEGEGGGESSQLVERLGGR